MIKARHRKFAHLTAGRFFLHLVRRSFSGVSVHAHPQPDPQRAMLVLPNHFSWWDGFFVYHLNHHLLHRRFHIMMLEEELQKRMVFARLGAYSIKKQHRSMLETFAYTQELLADPLNVVFMYPQGEIQPVNTVNVPWQPGVARLVQKLAPRQVQVVYAALFPEYGSHPKPHLHVWMKEAERPSEEEYNQFFYQSREALKAWVK